MILHYNWKITLPVSNPLCPERLSLDDIDIFKSAVYNLSETCMYVSTMKTCFMLLVDFSCKPAI